MITHLLVALLGLTLNAPAERIFFPGDGGERCKAHIDHTASGRCYVQFQGKNCSDTIYQGTSSGTYNDAGEEGCKLGSAVYFDGDTIQWEEELDVQEETSES